jgi:intraflagellar transport protein 172
VFAEAGDYAKAEAMLLKAKRADLAIKMYRELRKWEDALRVADEYMPTKVSGKTGFSLTMVMKKPEELAIKMYRELRKWEDALRVADVYMPTKVIIQNRV